MQEEKIDEKDWKLFRSKVALWQEAYMERLLREYVNIINSDGTAEEKFWKVARRIREDKKTAGVSVDMRRSQMERQIMELLSIGAIQLSDLDDFSDGLKMKMTFVKERLLK